MKNKIIKKAKELGIEYIGFCDAKRDDVLYEILKSRREKYGTNPFEEENIEKRVNPKLILSDAESVIVCLFPYYKKDRENSSFALFSSVFDYHEVVKSKLTALCTVLDGESTFIGCDTAPLSDRYLAYKAGLGFFGKNSMLINEKYGTYFAIGYILTSAKTEADEPLKRMCEDCGKCAAVCPGGAICEDFGFDYKKCLSYITQAKELSENQLEMLKKSEKTVGCDVCQSVCPHNYGILESAMPEFLEAELPELDLKEIFNMSNREFKRKYGKYAFSWLGKSIILRNLGKKS